MTQHTPAHPASQHKVSVGGLNYSDTDHFPDMGTTQCSLRFDHNEQIQSRLHTDLPLQLHIISCKKSDGIIPVKRTGSRPLFPFCQPKFKSDPTGGLAR